MDAYPSGNVQKWICRLWQNYREKQTYDTNAQIMWDKKAEIEAKEQTTMGNDNGKYTCELEYGEHKLHLTATLLNASEGQLEKGIGYLFGIREIAEKIPGFLPDLPIHHNPHQALMRADT